VSGGLALNVADVPLLQDPGSRVAIVTHREGELEGIAADVTWIRVDSGPGAMRAALEQLRSDHGVRSVMCEGGPTLNRSLLADGVVDQLFLSIAPKLAAGEPPFPILRGPALEDPLDLWILSCHEADDSLFLRYAVRRG
jgi:riboflavin biosynthesis pyrimidine reductase